MWIPKKFPLSFFATRFIHSVSLFLICFWVEKPLKIARDRMVLGQHTSIGHRASHAAKKVIVFFRTFKRACFVAVVAVAYLRAHQLQATRCKKSKNKAKTIVFAFLPCFLFSPANPKLNRRGRRHSAKILFWLVANMSHEVSDQRWCAFQTWKCMSCMSSCLSLIQSLGATTDTEVAVEL